VVPFTRGYDQKLRSRSVCIRGNSRSRWPGSEGQNQVLRQGGQSLMSLYVIYGIVAVMTLVGIGDRIRIHDELRELRIELRSLERKVWKVRD